jgi:hypothetical protein
MYDNGRELEDSMTLGELRKWQKQEPFEPFEIVMVDGRVFGVPHPEFIWIPPGNGTWVYVADPVSGSADHVNTVVISSVRASRKSGTSRRRKAG